MSQIESNKQLESRRILLIIGGGIAAYRSLDLIRRMRDRGWTVKTILTRSAVEFVTPLSVAALSENTVHLELLSLTEESKMGHIELARWAEAIVVAPATANLMARVAVGMADDLATTVLLATNRPILMAPSMNLEMWGNSATRHNHALLQGRGMEFVGPDSGDLACGEYGAGRLAEVPEIIAAIDRILHRHLTASSLAHKRFLITAGATREAIDPVRYISNHSSGKQGYALALALRNAGAEVILVSGITTLPAPAGIKTLAVTSAREMLSACLEQLPVDGAICTAAVADWRVAEAAPQKIKKIRDQQTLTLELVQNPDILATLSHHPSRPDLVIGFAAESESLIANAKIKLAAKGCDWIIANDIAANGAVFGSDYNQVAIITAAGVESLPQMTKLEVANHITQRIISHFNPAGGVK
ncbi:MAG: bifunctional phosphopantothenoylcysteine decarboxylase/phosphopantothenate--cysteine ligase CoaBC [Candidatus Pacebacteria bacterium]|nr:bifunctional phosphopantothenoylcysteine decarboxylase/phosphopantothenate--cysteine ligase CoaBC [Candidatus Paceibacterota bacterium]